MTLRRHVLTSFEKYGNPPVEFLVFVHAAAGRRVGNRCLGWATPDSIGRGSLMTPHQRINRKTAMKAAKRTAEKQATRHELPAANRHAAPTKTSGRLLTYDFDTTALPHEERVAPGCTVLQTKKSLEAAFYFCCLYYARNRVAESLHQG